MTPESDSTSSPVPPSVVRDLAPTGTLRAMVNLGNSVLAQGDSHRPSGVSVELARALAERLGVPVSLTCVDAARDSADAVVSGSADVAFLAVEPARAEQLVFSDPYVVIEGVYVVPVESSVVTAAQVDRPGVRVGVKLGSAYDLYLSRTLEHAQVVKGVDGIVVFREEGLDVGAGIRQPMEAYVAEHTDLRVVDGAFMQIRQAVAVSRERSQDSARVVATLVREALESGDVARWLRESGQDENLAATSA